jgi:hypothetical protein
MSNGKTGRIDTAHHHPRVRRAGTGFWVWACECGGASCRTIPGLATWRQALIGALNHAASLAP